MHNSTQKILEGKDLIDAFKGGAKPRMLLKSAGQHAKNQTPAASTLLGLSLYSRG